MELGSSGTLKDDKVFLRFQLPQSIENAHISEVYRQLKDAWSSLPRGIVKFDFNDGDGQLSLRRVEPHSVIMRSGNAYLIGYDLALNTWGSFGLHRITSVPVRDLSATKIRDMPADLDVHGFGGSDRLSSLRYVGTISLSPPIPLSILICVHRPGQAVEFTDDGTAHISFPTSDLNDIVRSSLQFGDGATVISPPEAVALAEKQLEKMMASYRSKSRPT